MSQKSHAGHNHEPADNSKFPPYDWRVGQPQSFWNRILRRGAKSGAPPERAGSVELWYPEASRKVAMPTRGTYADGYPIGAVVHTTEGHSKKGDQNAEDTMEDAANNPDPNQRFCYFCISSTGRVYQPAPLNLWGWHAGRTYHPVLGRDLNTKLVGIEMCNAGLLERTSYGWKPRDYDDARYGRWSERYTDAELRPTDRVFNVTEAGTYHCMTAAQEDALTKLLLWMHGNNPSVFKLDNVVGHDEVAIKEGTQTEIGRKQDPGASLSLYMPAYRTKLAGMALTS